MQHQNAVTNQPPSATPAPWVVTPGDGHFAVYRADLPGEIFQVSGTPEDPACTCPDAHWRTHRPEHRCEHMLVVFGARLQDAHGPSPRPSAYSNPDPGGNAQDPLAGQLVLRRSASPDGRINSLSVEYGFSADGLANDDLVSVVRDILRLEEHVVNEFRQAAGHLPPTDAPQAGAGGANGAVPATLRDVSGMNTRHGWRYFINVETPSGVLKLFGTKKTLEEHLTAAGYPQHMHRIQKGAYLNLPCSAFLAPSQDGRYTNVESLAPAGGNGRGGQ